MKMKLVLTDTQQLRLLVSKATERDRVMVLARAYRIALRRANRRERHPASRFLSRLRITDKRFVQFCYRNRWLLYFDNPDSYTGPMPADCR